MTVFNVDCNPNLPFPQSDLLFVEVVKLIDQPIDLLHGVVDGQLYLPALCFEAGGYWLINKSRTAKSCLPDVKNSH